MTRSNPNPKFPTQGGWISLASSLTPQQKEMLAAQPVRPTLKDIFVEQVHCKALDVFWAAMPIMGIMAFIWIGLDAFYFEWGHWLSVIQTAGIEVFTALATLFVCSVVSAFIKEMKRP